MMPLIGPLQAKPIFLRTASPLRCNVGNYWFAQKASIT